MKNPVRSRRTSRGATRPTKGKKLQGGMRLIKLTASMLVLAALFLATQQILLQANRPITEIRISGNFDQEWSAQLQEKLNNFGGAGLLDIDLDELKAEIELIPWVAQVSLSRQWPSTLVVDIQEHRLVARWNDEGYVSDQGQLVKGYQVDRPLALLVSNSGEPINLLQEYRRLNQAMSQVGLTLIELKQSRTGDLSLLLNNGIWLKLGNRDLLSRIQRFVAIWELDLYQREQQIKQIDVRYARGLAVNWNEGADQSAAVRNFGETYGAFAGR